MSLARLLAIAGKDLRQGPRSPLCIWALFMPLLITFLVQVVLLALFDQAPRLGIVDPGGSELARAARSLKGIQARSVASAGELRELVAAHDLDAGLVLPPGFDAAVRAGERPELEFFLSGECLLPNRMVLAVTLLDLARGLREEAAPVEVVLHESGRALPIDRLLVLSIMLFVLIISGIFVPAFLLVEEREHRTLEAVLVTPATLREVLLAKAALGFGMTLVMSCLTLVLNGALPGAPLALLATLAVAALFCVEVGLIYGLAARDAKGLYTLVKSLNLVLAAPVVFYFFPDWPQWIARIFPTYWIIDPLYRTALQGATLGAVASELAIAMGWCLALLVPVRLLGPKPARLAPRSLRYAR